MSQALEFTYYSLNEITHILQIENNPKLAEVTHQCSDVFTRLYSMNNQYFNRQLTKYKNVTLLQNHRGAPLGLLKGVSIGTRNQPKRR